MSALRLLARLARMLAGILVSLALLAGTALAVLWAWSSTQESLDWAWQRFAQPRGLQAEGLTGSLRQGLHARRLQARAGDWHLDLQGVAITWDLRALLERRVHITGLRVERLHVQGGRADLRTREAPRSPPASLTLPVGVTVDPLTIGLFAWDGPLPLRMQDIAAAYRYDPSLGSHRLTLNHVVVADGRYRAQASLGDQAPFPTQGWLRGEVQPPAAGRMAPVRLDLHANIEGTLETLGLRLKLQPAAGIALPDSRPLPSADMTVQITPWQAPFVPEAHARLRQVDLATLWADGPRTALDGRIDLRPQRADGWQMHIDLTNALPGPWDRQRLPLTRVEATADWRSGELRVGRLRAHIGNKGEDGQIEGRGRWHATRGGHLEIRLHRVQAGALHSALAAGPGGLLPSALEGQLQARSREGASQWRLAVRTVAHPPGSAQHLRLALQAQAERRAERGSGAPAMWVASIDHLHLALPDPRAASRLWTLRLQAPVNLRTVAGARWHVGAGQAVITSAGGPGAAAARVAWAPLQWGNGQLHSAGRLSGLPLAWLTLSGRGLPQSDMVFDGHWDVHLADTLRVSARLERARGDITLLAETAEGAPARVAAGVREASLAIQSVGEDIRLQLRWSSERAGTVEGTVATRLSRGGRAGWHWAKQAPLAGRIQARLPRIAAWSMLAPPGWRVRGSLEADVAVSGTRTQPQVSGPLRADDLALRSVVDGVALQGGRLRARLDNRRILIDDLHWQAGGGTLRASGLAGWSDAGSQGPAGLFAHIEAHLDHLAASVRRDRLITLSGRVFARADASQVSLEGNLRVDRARVTVPDEPTPRLGDDVTVHNLPAGIVSPWTPGTPPARTLRLALDIDLGQDARVSGRGVDTGLRGQVRLTGDSFAQPRLVGVVSAFDGRYSAYGQRLTLQRGVLRFTGAHDDPAVDVLAVRADLDRQVGVQVTGRAKAPVFRLWSREPATEAEKLAWLMLGRGAAAGGAETVLLEQAALSLLTRRAGLGTGGIAAAFGLDEVSLRRDGGQGAAITFGKRLGRNLYAAYERTLSGALGTLYVFLDLTERLTLRAEAGDRTGLDLIYALSFDQLGDAPPPPSAPAKPHGADRRPP